MSTSNRSPSPGYQFSMLVLSAYALAVLAIQRVISLEPNVQEVLYYADYAVCVLFLTDFVVCLVQAPNRWRYFYTWGWIDLLSSVPMLDLARWGRAARVFKIFRVLRGLRATKLLAGLVLRRRAENTLLAATLVALLLVVSCSIAMLQFETGPESNIRTAEDALWWAVATITTVGYGDRYPVTPEGRFVAGILMCVGVGLFGTFSGFVAAWFLAPEEAHQESEVVALRREIEALVWELRADPRRSQ